jgi:hypothetical protein
MKLKEYLTTLIRKYNISFGYFMEMPSLVFLGEVELIWKKHKTKD